MMLKVNPFETYKTFIGMKSHFIREKYDYARYGNKLSKLTVQGFYKRRDRMFFERMSRQYNDQEIQDFFIANFH